MDQLTFYVTTPIYYVNAEPHIGHAYTTVVADALARFHRLQGRETRFQTGTDEHGEKVVEAARAHGMAVTDYVDLISGKFRQTWDQLQISYDKFIRTTAPEHTRVVQYFLNRVREQGDIYFSEYAGYYCFGCERFVLERELVDGRCPDHLTEPTFVKEGNYFFRMSRYQEWLVHYLEANPETIRPERYRNEVLSFLKEPLEDLCISRPRSRVPWGIPLPFDDHYVTYVWFDALINYLSGLGYPESPDFAKFWPSCQHLIAKDILKPHAIYWPTMLKSAGIEMYRHLNVHGYWQLGQGKMSKSLGNVVEPLALASKYGLDQLRYFFLREMVYGLDAAFSEEALIGRINADLANDLGNLFARSLAMAFKYRQGLVPPPTALGPAETQLAAAAAAMGADFQAAFGRLEFHRALSRLWEFINEVNRYIVTSEPWGLAKRQEEERLNLVLYTILEALRWISVLLLPVMPAKAAAMLGQLGLALPPAKATFATLLVWGGLQPGTGLQRGEILFPRVELSAVQAAAPAPVVLSDKPLIELADLQKLDLRVGVITAAARIPKSEKLLRLEVDLGSRRQVVAGIAQFYRPEDLVGRQVVVVANLKPAKLMGLESAGMVLAAKDGEKLVLLSPVEEVKPGAPIS